MIKIAGCRLKIAIRHPKISGLKIPVHSLKIAGLKIAGLKIIARVCVYVCVYVCAWVRGCAPVLPRLANSVGCTQSRNTSTRATTTTGTRATTSTRAGAHAHPIQKRKLKNNSKLIFFKLFTQYLCNINNKTQKAMTRKNQLQLF